MKINSMILAVLALLLLAAIPVLTGCSKPEAAASTGSAIKYTCSMHPEVVKDEPGNCPKCGMKLVEKK